MARDIAGKKQKSKQQSIPNQSIRTEMDGGTIELTTGDTVIDRENGELCEAIVVDLPDEEERKCLGYTGNTEKTHGDSRRGHHKGDDPIVTVVFKLDLDTWSKQHGAEPAELLSAVLKDDISRYNYPLSRLKLPEQA